MNEDPLLIAAAIYFGILAGDKYEPEMGDMPEPSWTMAPIAAEPVVAEVPSQTVDTTLMEASSGN